MTLQPTNGRSWTIFNEVFIITGTQGAETCSRKTFTQPNSSAAVKSQTLSLCPLSAAISAPTFLAFWAFFSNAVQGLSAQSQPSEINQINDSLTLTAAC